MEMVSFASHCWSEHLRVLKERIHHGPFTRRVVVVGGPLIKEMLMAALLKDDGVVFGLKIRLTHRFAPVYDG